MNALEELEQAAAQNDDERYLLLEKLGQGGMGQVWLAEKLGPDGTPLRTVVLKTVLPFASSDEEMERRAALFLREMAVTAKLEHRNIVRVTDWGTDLFGSTHFFEMERIKGLSLLDLLARRGVPLDQERRWGALPPQDIAWIGMQAAAGLHYAHNHARTGEDDTESGVAHRDVSPDNIMLDIAGEVKVTDWGITKALDNLGEASRTGMIAGKAKYMAPEQIRGQIDSRADVYSLGVTLTVALAGKDVFPTTKSSSWESIAMAVLQGKRDPVAQLAPDAPPALQALLESMMHVNRDQRPRTAGELVERFKDIAIQLGGDLYAVQQQFAARVQEHHKEGRRTKRAMRAHESAPTKSTRRPISAATQPDHASHDDSPAQPDLPAQPATQQISGPPAPSAKTRPFDPHPEASRSPALAPAPTTSARPVLWVALGGGIVTIILLAAIAGFIFAGSDLREDSDVATSTTAQANGGSGGELRTQEAVETHARPADHAAPVEEPSDTQETAADPPAPSPPPPPFEETPPEAAQHQDTTADMEQTATPDPPRVQDAIDTPRVDEPIEPGRARIVAIPEGQITVDGRPRGSSPITISLSPGAHIVIARHPDGRTARQRVRVRSGRTVQVMLRYP